MSMAGNLYQLAGPKYLRVGDYVNIGPGGYDQWGVIRAVVKEDYKLPNPCMVEGARKFIMQPLNLFLIRGIPRREMVDENAVPCVYSFTS
jgi:hypothetical protein